MKTTSYGLPAVWKGFEPDEHREPKVDDVVEVHTFEPLLCRIVEVDPDGLGGVRVEPLTPIIAIWEGRWSQFPF
jgi:hypothetical protein